MLAYPYDKLYKRERNLLTLNNSSMKNIVLALVAVSVLALPAKAISSRVVFGFEGYNLVNTGTGVVADPYIRVSLDLLIRASPVSVLSDFFADASLLESGTITIVSSFGTSFTESFSLGNFSMYNEVIYFVGGMPTELISLSGSASGISLYANFRYSDLRGGDPFDIFMNSQPLLYHGSTGLSIEKVPDPCSTASLLFASILGFVICFRTTRNRVVDSGE